jgi:glycosyltransferase involved in cell wall biosynthesis
VYSRAGYRRYDRRVSESRIPVSVIVMTKEEERNIARCLNSVQRFEEIVVVDSGSIDRTCELAEGLGARIVQFQWNGGYPKKKQWTLENVEFASDWVLYVDADEVVTDVLAEEIAGLFRRGPSHSGYFVSYDYKFMDKVLAHGHRYEKLVLLHKRRAEFLDYDDLEAVNMWEVEGHYQPKVHGTIGKLGHRMIHSDAESLFHYFERHNRYSDWEAVLRAKGIFVHPDEATVGRRAWLKRTFDRLPAKGVAAFLHSYLFKLGFLDGRAGRDFALARGFYYWQVRLKSRERALRSAAERREDTLASPTGRDASP